MEQQENLGTILSQNLPKYTDGYCSFTVVKNNCRVLGGFISQPDQLTLRGFKITFNIKKKIHTVMFQLKEFNMSGISHLVIAKARTGIQVFCFLAQYPPMQEYVFRKIVMIKG